MYLHGEGAWDFSQPNQEINRLSKIQQQGKSSKKFLVLVCILNLKWTVDKANILFTRKVSTDNLKD